jgi:hypothetical protein
MRKTPKFLGLIFIGTIVLNLTSCDLLNPNNAGISTEGTTMTVTGYNKITNTLTISAGMTVTFKEDRRETPGEIYLADGGKLIAQGTASSPIVFQNVTGQSHGHLTFKENSSIESVVEYCEFKEHTLIEMESSGLIQHCKFDSSFVVLSKLCNSLIQYNSFVSSQDNYIFIKSGGGGDYQPTPKIQYNNFEGGLNGMEIFSSPEFIKYNNILNSSDYAIYYPGSDYLGGEFPDKYTADNNYIANCDGQSGVDTTGIQSRNVTYTNPQTSPVSSAGCGW